MAIGLGRLLHTPDSLLNRAIRIIKISAFLEVSIVEDFIIANVLPLFEQMETAREYRIYKPALKKFLSTSKST